LLAYKVRSFSGRIVITRVNTFSRLPLLISSHQLQGLVRNSVPYPRCLACIHLSQRRG
jgi:hypothetical protein